MMILSIKSSLTISIAILLSLLLCACDEKEYIVDDSDLDDGGSVPTDNYSVETEPTLSPNREYLYYISVDPLNDYKNGIYRARLSSPRREEVLGGSGYHSPTVSFNNGIVAYLLGGKVRYYSIVGDSSWASKIGDSFESIVYVNNTLMAGERGGSIYLIDEAEEVASLLISGRNPTLYDKDTIVFVKALSPTGYGVALCDVTAKEATTLGSIPVESRPIWVSLEPGVRRFVFALQGTSGYQIYSSQVGTSTINSIALSSYSKAYIFNSYQLIYSGPDGRFYLSNFDGSSIIPYWYAEGDIQ